jgi:hypothetical protein
MIGLLVRCRLDVCEELRQWVGMRVVRTPTHPSLALIDEGPFRGIIMMAMLMIAAAEPKDFQGELEWATINTISMISWP